MSANETAEAILIVIKRLLKWASIAALIVLILAAILYGYFSFDEWYSRDRHKQKVIVDAGFDEKVCSKDFPLLIKVLNKSSKTISSINIGIDVTKNGFSSRINGYGSFDYDKIIKPEEGWGQCWAVETQDSTGFSRKYLDGKNMSVKVTYFNPVFEK